MKKYLFFIFIFLFLTSSFTFAQEDENIYDENVQNQEEELQEPISSEEKIMDEDTVYFDIAGYKKRKDESKIFKLKVEQNEELLKNIKTFEGLNFQTKYTNTDIEKSQLNNKTTIAATIMSNSKIGGEHLSFGYGAGLKEYMPIPDSSNYSLLTTSLYSRYKIKNLVFEGEFGNNNNILTEKFSQYMSLGSKINITKSTAIKGSVTKMMNENTIYGELSLIYKPFKNKRNFYVEFDALSTNTQYNIPQQRFQVFGKLKI